MIDVDVAAPEYRCTEQGSPFWPHPGRLAGVSGLDLVVVMPMAMGPKGLYALERNAAGRTAWRDTALEGTRWSLQEGGVAFTSDDRFLLSATQGDPASASYADKPPYGIVKYDRGRISLNARTTGPELGYYETGLPVAEIVPDPDPDLVHLVMVPGPGLLAADCPVALATLDVTTMTEIGRRIDLAPIRPSGINPWWSQLQPVATVRAAMAPDGRHIAVSLWADSALAVADTVVRAAWRLGDQGVAELFGLFGQSSESSGGLLAVVGRSSDLTVGSSLLQHAVDDDRELARGGSDRLGGPDAEGQATLVGSESVVAAAVGHDRHP